MRRVVPLGTIAVLGLVGGWLLWPVGDAFIVFRAAGVMHARDAFPGVNVVARNGGSEAAYATTMSRAAAEITGVHTVIPGHGVVATWQEFVNNAAAIRARR